MQIDHTLQPSALRNKLDRFWSLSGQKIRQLAQDYDRTLGSPVFTVEGRYTTRGWTEWTQGFEYGSAILQYDATGDESFLNYGRTSTLEHMASHVTHFGVHDHGFNNVSTYGNLLRLAWEGRYAVEPWERHFYELALKCSAAAQARRWTSIANGEGFIYSFNGPHSLFADTIRSLRALALGHQLGHVLMEEGDRVISLLDRLVQHARATARYNVYYGRGRDAYDVRGRTAHESIFNLNDGQYRCPSSQQGFSPFTTWTRGQAWIITGYAEQLEYLRTVPDDQLDALGGRAEIESIMREAAQATCDFWIERTPADGIPYWDTGAPQLYRLGDITAAPADPFNPYEPVDSSAAAIAAQGLLRLGRYLRAAQPGRALDYVQAGLALVSRLLEEPYLSTDSEHQGLLLHSVYHRPNGWDFVPAGRQVPCGESSLWGDYHIREVALYVQRLIDGGPEHSFFMSGLSAG